MPLDEELKGTDSGLTVVVVTTSYAHTPAATRLAAWSRLTPPSVEHSLTDIGMTTVLVFLEATGDDEVAKVDGANANETSATIRRDEASRLNVLMAENTSDLVKSYCQAAWKLLPAWRDQAARTSSGGRLPRIPSTNCSPPRTRAMRVAPPLRTRQCWPTALDDLPHEVERVLPDPCPLGHVGPQPDLGEHRLDRVARAQVEPVLGR